MSAGPIPYRKFTRFGSERARQQEPAMFMSDVLNLALALAAFGLFALYVPACDKV